MSSSLQKILEKYNISQDSVQQTIIKDKRKSYNESIKKCRNFDEIINAIKGLQQSKQLDIEHINIALFSLLTLYSNSHTDANQFIDEADQIIAIGHNNQLASNEKTYGIYIAGLVRFNDLAQALAVLSHIPAQINYLPIFGVFLQSCLDFGHYDYFVDAINNFNGRDKIIYSIILGYFEKIKNAQEIAKLANEILSNQQLEIDTRLYNKLINALCLHSQNHDQAIAVFDLMEKIKLKRDIYSYNIMIKHYSKLGNIRQALLLFEYMKSQKINPDIVTYNSLLNCFVRTRKINEAEIFVDHLFNDRKVQADIVTYNTILDLYAKSSYQSKYADKFLQILTHLRATNLKLTIITYTIIINFFCKKHNLAEINNFLDEMTNNGIAPNQRIYASIMKMHGETQNYDEIYSLYDSAIKDFQGHDCHVLSCILLEYAATQGDINEVNNIFNNIKSLPNDSDNFNSIISAYLDAIYSISIKSGNLDYFWQNYLTLYQQYLALTRQPINNKVNCHNMTPGSFALMLLDQSNKGKLFDLSFDIGKEKRSTGKATHRLSFVPKALNLKHDYNIETGLIRFIRGV